MNSFKDVDQSRLVLLNRFMEEYRESPDKKGVVEKYEEILQDITPLEIFSLNDYSTETLLSLDQIKSEAGKFVNLFNHGLKKFSWNRACSPLMEHFLKENEAIRQHLGTMKEAVKTLNDPQSKRRFRASLAQLAVVENKFIKMQNILFPIMEKKIPSTRPLTVLWSLHDDCKALMDKILSHLKQPETDEKLLNKQIGEFYFLLMGILYKEEHILFPIASYIINKEEWEQMAMDAAAFPAVLIEPLPTEERSRKPGTSDSHHFKDLTGTLNFEQLALIMRHLPIDITFVDEHNRVTYYNETTNRLFPRTPAVIGRSVELCHPEKSVHVVKKIIESFRLGLADQAEFWIEYKNRFIYIVYYALRDEQNNYKGVLEVTQDATLIRSLQGQKRLLDW